MHLVLGQEVNEKKNHKVHIVRYISIQISK